MSSDRRRATQQNLIACNVDKTRWLNNGRIPDNHWYSVPLSKPMNPDNPCERKQPGATCAQRHRRISPLCFRLLVTPSTAALLQQPMPNVSPPPSRQRWGRGQAGGGSSCVGGWQGGGGKVVFFEPFWRSLTRVAARGQWIKGNILTHFFVKINKKDL